MLNTKIIILSCLCSGLVGCNLVNDQPFHDYYGPSNFTYNPLYPEGYENANLPNPTVSSSKDVVVPESYHVGATHSPIPPKDVDRSWINSQSPDHYTIELADADKPSQVAKALDKTPKNERTAEIKYQRDGKAYYKGIYGSYDSYEAAQAALKSLPDEVKQNAGIKKWNSVQQATDSME